MTVACISFLGGVLFTLLILVVPFLLIEWRRSPEPRRAGGPPSILQKPVRRD